MVRYCFLRLATLIRRTNIKEDCDHHQSISRDRRDRTVNQKRRGLLLIVVRIRMNNMKKVNFCSGSKVKGCCGEGVNMYAREVQGRTVIVMPSLVI